MLVRKLPSIFAAVMLLPSCIDFVSANDGLLMLQNDDTQWVMQGKNYSNWRYSTLTQITRDNIKNLHVAWSFSVGTTNGQEGGPLVVGTTMYVHSSYPNHVYALDLTKEGAPMKWKYTPKQDARAVPVACCDLVHRGVQYAPGTPPRILMATLDGQIIALDANTGKELWKAKSADPVKGQTITGAGLIVGNKYIQGVSGDDFGIRGWVDAYDIDTGKRVWRAYSTGPDEDVRLAHDFNSANPHYGQKGLGTATWPGDQWKVGGGGSEGYWSWDPELNLVYTSTGNPGTMNPTPRKGDNKWSMTIFARNPDIGVAKWGYQMTPWDGWNYKGVNETILTAQVIGGEEIIEERDVHFISRVDLRDDSGKPVMEISQLKSKETKRVCLGHNGDDAENVLEASGLGRGAYKKVRECQRIGEPDVLLEKLEDNEFDVLVLIHPAPILVLEPHLGKTARILEFTGDIRSLRKMKESYFVKILDNYRPNKIRTVSIRRRIPIPRKTLTHFDRNGFAYTLNPADGTLFVAEPFVYVNWAKGIDIKVTGRPIENPEKRTKQGADTKDICPSAMGGKSQAPAAYSPRTNLFYVPTNNLCMNYEGVLVQYTAGAPYVGANLLMFAGRGGHGGELLSWDGVHGKKVWGIKEPFPVQSGPVVTASDLVFYGTMDGWLKAADARTGEVVWKHKVASGIIGNPMTYQGPDGRQHVAVLSGVGGWFGAIVSLDIPPDDPFGALGEVNAAYSLGLDKATTKGGILYDFALD